MKHTNNTPSHRKHANSQCNCHQCKQFDYANTAIFSRSERPSSFAVVEFGAIDSETWERYNYYVISPRKPTPIQKEHMVKCMSDIPSRRKHPDIQCNCHQCKQFDYANTAIFTSSEQPPPFAVAEQVRAIDSETWERYNYYVSPSCKSAPV